MSTVRARPASDSRTILIAVHDGDIARNYLRSSLLSDLRAAGVRIVILVRSHLDHYRQQFAAPPDVTVEPLPSGQTKLETFFYHIAWNTLPTNAVRLRRHDFYLQHKNGIRYRVEHALGILGQSRLWRQWLRWLYLHLPDDYAAGLFDRYRPAVVFAPNMFSAEDSRLLRFAKRRGIPAVTAVKSWDVLTTKAFTRVLADRILVPNMHTEREAQVLGGYRREQIRVVGLPQFDVYADPGAMMSRAEFFQSIGADPAKKLVLYAAPGDWKNPHDVEVIEGLHAAIAAGAVGAPVQVLVRFHPKYPHRAERKRFPLFILDRPGTHLSEFMEESIEAALGKSYDWTFVDKDVRRLANSLFHCDVVINTESTMTLDAAAFDKPVILIGYDGHRRLDYWQSIRRNYDREHYQYVLQTGGARLALSERDLIAHLNDYLLDPSLDAEGRERIRRELIFKVDGNSGRRIADAILELLDQSR